MLYARFSKVRATGVYRSRVFLRKTIHKSACNLRATHRYFRRFQAYPSCIMDLQKSYMYKGFLSILSKEKPGLFNPDFWCGRWDLNPYGLPYAPQTYASACSATTAKFDCERYYNSLDAQCQHPNSIFSVYYAPKHLSKRAFSGAFDAARITISE